MSVIIRIVVVCGIITCINGCFRNSKQYDELATRLNNAIVNSDLKDAQAAITAGADVNNSVFNDQQLPLQIAIMQNNADMVKLLLDSGANPNLVGSYLNGTTLSQAADSGNERIFDMLIEKGAKVRDPNDLLWWAAMGGNDQIVKKLLARGGKANARQYMKSTPLHVVSSAGAAKLLLSAGAEIEAKEEGGSRPLHCAADSEHIEIVKILLAAGADKEAQDEKGKRPLHFAAYRGNEEIVRILLDAGVDRNAKDSEGKTAAMLARECNHEQIAELLERRE